MAVSPLYSVNDKGNGAYNTALGGLAQESSKGDDGGHACAVEEEEGGQTLQTNGIGIVGKVVRSLSLHI